MAAIFLSISLFAVFLTEPLALTLDISGECATLSADLVFFGVTLSRDGAHKAAQHGKTNRKRSGRKFPPDTVFRAIVRVLRGATVVFPRTESLDPMRRALLLGWIFSFFHVLDVHPDPGVETGVIRLKVRVFRIVTALLLLFAESEPKKKG